MLISNFKSFGKEEERVGPFLQLSSIVGPNGSGKSNIIEAIQFIMNDK